MHCINVFNIKTRCVYDNTVATHRLATWVIGCDIHRPKKVLGHSLLYGSHGNHQIWNAIFWLLNVIVWWKFAWVYPMSSSVRQPCCLKYNRYNIHKNYYIIRRCNFIHVSAECAFKNVSNGERGLSLSNWIVDIMVAMICDNSIILSSR